MRLAEHRHPLIKRASEELHVPKEFRCVVLRSHTRGERRDLVPVQEYVVSKDRVEQATGSGAPPLGTVVEVFIQDNGAPGHGLPDANATRAPEFPPFGQLDAGNCDDPSLQPEWNPIDTGNYTVGA